MPGPSSRQDVPLHKSLWDAWEGVPVAGPGFCGAVPVHAGFSWSHCQIYRVLHDGVGGVGPRAQVPQCQGCPFLPPA